MGTKFHEATSKLLDVMRRAWLKKHGVPLPAPTMTAQQRAEIQECFEMLDRDGSGALDVKEIVHAFGALGFSISKDAISELMSEADPDGSGELEFDEFLSLMGRALYQPDERGVTLVAKTGSGDLSFADVVRAFRRKKLIESLIRGGDARLKVVEFHERVQALVREEAKSVRHRENTHDNFQRMENLKVERGKMDKVSKLHIAEAPAASQRSQKVKAKMRDAISRSLGVFENLYQRHQSESQLEGNGNENENAAMLPHRASITDGGGGGGGGGGGPTSRCSSPGLGRAVTFLTELGPEASGGSLNDLGLLGKRRPRSHSEYRRRPSRSSSTSTLGRTQPRRVSIAVLKYFKHLEEQAKKVEQKYDDAARITASLVQPAPDRSLFNHAIQKSLRPTSYRSGQSATIHTTTTSSHGGAVTSSTGAATSLSGGASSGHDAGMSCGAAVGVGQSTPAAAVAAADGISRAGHVTTSDGGSGRECSVTSDGDGLECSQCLPPPLPLRPQRQRLLSDGSEVRPEASIQAGYDGLLTAAWTEFMAAAAAMSAGVSLTAGGSGGVPLLPPPPPPPVNTTGMASRAWRQTPSFGSAGNSMAPMGWGSGVPSGSVRRGGGGAGGGGVMAGPALHISRSIGPGTSFVTESGGGSVAPQSVASLGDMWSNLDGRQALSPRVGSGRTMYDANLSGSVGMALPMLPLSGPSAASVAAAPLQDAAPSSRARSTSPRDQLQPKRFTSFSGAAGGAALPMNNRTSQAGMSSPTEAHENAGQGAIPEVQLSRSTVVSAGMASGGGGGGGGGGGNGLGLHAPGPMARAWLAHARSMLPGGVNLGGNSAGSGGGAAAATAAGGVQQPSFRQGLTYSPRRPPSVSANGTTQHGVAAAGSVSSNASTTGPPGGSSAFKPSSAYSHGPFRAASRGPAGGGSAVGPAAVALVEGIVSIGPAPGVMQPHTTASAVPHGLIPSGASDGRVREQGRHSRLGFKSLPSEIDLGSNVSSTLHSHRDTGASGCDDFLSLTGASALRTTRRNYRSESEGSGSRGPTIEGSPGSGDGSGGGTFLRTRRLPANALGSIVTSGGPASASAGAVGTATASSAEAAPAAVALDEEKIDVAAVSQDVASRDGDVADATSANASEDAPAAPAPAPAPAPATSADEVAMEVAGSVHNLQGTQATKHVPSMPTSKLNGCDSLQSSVPSGSAPTSPRYLPVLRPPVSTVEESASSLSACDRHSSADGSSCGQVTSPRSITNAAAAAATAPTAATAVTSLAQIHSTYSIPSGAAIVTTNAGALPPQATNTMPAISPMRSRGAGTASSGNVSSSVTVIPAAYAPRGAYMSLQLASQRSGGGNTIVAGAGGTRSPRRMPAESSGTANSPGRSPATMKPPTAPAESPPAARTPPLHDRVVVTFFGQALPRARNGAVILPAMGLQPPSYPPELQQYSFNAPMNGGAPTPGRALTPSHMRSWHGVNTPPTVGSGGGSGGNYGATPSPMAATAAAAAAWLTFPGGTAGLPPPSPHLTAASYGNISAMDPRRQVTAAAAAASPLLSAHPSAFPAPSSASSLQPFHNSTHMPAGLPPRYPPSTPLPAAAPVLRAGA